MKPLSLGRLTTLSAQEVWGSEAHVFTPWLAANLDLLADALQLGELEHQGTEVIAGDFRLDILATDSAGDPVVIENQFGRTDHGHLGQLISYVASQNRPATTIWVAEQFKDSHRAAIDWLNASTSQDYSFFAVEIEALRIGDSDPAPFFNVVAKPNSWTKSVRAGGSAASATGDQERHRVRLAYWSAFADYLRTHDKSFMIRRENRDHWFEFPIGRSGVVISATISTQKKRIGVELYLHRDPNKAGIRQLSAQREAIVAEFGAELDWQELHQAGEPHRHLPQRRRSRRYRTTPAPAWLDAGHDAAFPPRLRRPRQATGFRGRRGNGRAAGVKASGLHNPRCSKSREALAILAGTPGVEVEIVDYLRHPPSRAELARLYAKAGLSPREGLRVSEDGAKRLKDASHEAILDAMAADPILIERPLVETANGVQLGRPPERVREIL